ncbi:MAG TPA: DUF3311 domain-containing protein [Rhodanobacteraceae bacterium]|nr:DUF3311 domain-containing protein [Rhodanobacteraceae bacterium]
MNRRLWPLALPFVATLSVPLYARHDPVLWGFPFFYWYLFAWIPLASALTWAVHRRMRR